MAQFFWYQLNIGKPCPKNCFCCPLLL